MAEIVRPQDDARLKPRAIAILDVRIDDVTLDECCDHVARAIEGGDASQIATVNPEFVMIAERDTAFAAALRATRLNTPDGVGIMIAAQRGGVPLRERVTGVDLSERLLARAAHAGWRVFLLGAAPGVAEHAATIWARRYPGLVVAGTHAGSPDPAEDASITGQVRASNAQIVLVAYGAPRQDLWLARNLPSLREAGAALGVVGIGVGGVFDYVAGVRPLAPAWARRAGLEWFYRLVNEPSRWRRQLALLRFLGRIALSAPSRYDRDREMPGR